MHIFIVLISPVPDEPEIKVNKVGESLTKLIRDRFFIHLSHLVEETRPHLPFAFLITSTGSNEELEPVIELVLTIAELEVDFKDRLEEVGAGALGATYVRLQDVDDEDVGGDRSEASYVTLDILVSDYSALSTLRPFAVEQQYGRRRLSTWDDFDGDALVVCL